MAQLGRTSSAERLLGTSTSLFRDSSAAILLDSDSNADEVLLSSAAPYPYDALGVGTYRIIIAQSSVTGVMYVSGLLPSPRHPRTHSVTAPICTLPWSCFQCLDLRKILHFQIPRARPGRSDTVSKLGASRAACDRVSYEAR